MRILEIGSGRARPLNNNVFINTLRVIYATIGFIDRHAPRKPRPLGPGRGELYKIN
jgi:hypothetical protein